MAEFIPGKILGPEDLRISIRDSKYSTLINPFSISYSIWYATPTNDVEMYPPTTPVKVADGTFFAPYQIPLDAPTGPWIVRWNVVETPGAPIVEVIQEFKVVSPEVAAPEATLSRNELNRRTMVGRLRVFLRDNNPDRNYRFRPPNTDKFLQAQTEVFGFIWTDDELEEYLLMAIDDLNSSPPYTLVDFASIPDRWRTAIIYRAAAIACRAMSLNWVADEFSVKGDTQVHLSSIQGEISLGIEELYNAYSLMVSGGEDLSVSKKALEWAIRLNNDEVFTKSCDNSGQGVYSKVSGIVRHISPLKRIAKITTETGKMVECTSDHSLFKLEEETLSEVTPEELSVGQEIVCLGGLEKVLQIEFVESEYFTYDLMVPGTNNFFVNDGILAHNTYSIGGVSLDIDKSAKYQAMADGYDQQYEQMRELIKRSIKIVKGLSQSRYGIGISSALGPMTAPGSMSRRNFIGR